MRELAEKMSETGDPVHFTTIAKIERSERKLTPEWIARFAAALDAMPAEVAGADRAGLSSVMVRQIPVIGMVSAGNWQQAVQETSEFIAAPVANPRGFGLVVSGDSMDQIAPDGARVMIDPDATDLRNGRYYVVMNGDGETTFKRYRADPSRLEPCSNNPAHKAIALGQDPFTIVGMVVGVYMAL
jgi:repressor LexA